MMSVTGDVLVLAEYAGDEIQDSTYELLGKARELAHGWGGKAEVVLLGEAGAAELASQLGAADAVILVEHPALAGYLPEPYEQALLHVLRERSPRLLLLSNSTIGIDLGAALSVLWHAPLAAYVAGLSVDDGEPVET